MLLVGEFWIRTLPQRALLCRETQRFWDFLGGVHPVELALVLVSGLWRGMGESAVLGIVQVSVHVNVKSARGQIVGLDLRSRLVLNDFLVLREEGGSARETDNGIFEKRILGFFFAILELNVTVFGWWCSHAARFFVRFWVSGLGMGLVEWRRRITYGRSGIVWDSMARSGIRADSERFYSEKSSRTILPSR